MPKKRSTKTDGKASKQLNKTPKQKTLTHAQAKKKCDEWFSKYVRWKAADKDGTCTCFTCGNKHHASRIQAGHFASRKYLNTRYDTDNVRCQCASCNIFNHGEQWIFGRNLDREQQGRAADIMRRAHISRKFTKAELEHMYRHFRAEAIAYSKRKDVMPKGRTDKGSADT
jgi:hypothetical protein